MGRPVNVVASRRTVAIAHMMVATARETSPAEAVLEHMHRTPSGQGVALLAHLLGLAVEGAPDLEPVIVYVEKKPERDPETERGGGLTESEERELADAYMTEAASRFAVPVEDLTGPGRAVRLIKARHLAMWALRQHGLFLPRIGELFGGKDHTSVLHAVRRVDHDTELRQVGVEMLAVIRDERDVA